MDANTITTLISSVGFPIACCFAMGYFIITTLKDFQATTNAAISEMHKSIDQNTLVIEKLSVIIDKLDK